MSFSTGEYQERKIKRRSKFGENKLNFYNRKWDILIRKDSISLNKWNTNNDAQNKKNTIFSFQLQICFYQLTVKKEIKGSLW